MWTFDPLHRQESAMTAITVQPARSKQDQARSPPACVSALETLYPRICAALVQMWFRDEIDRYLDSLILDDRFDRQGFPYEVLDELLFLSDLRWGMRHDRRKAEVAHPDGDYTFLSRGRAGGRW
jgi:hypothetical protein